MTEHKSEYISEEIELARSNEAKNKKYIPLCARIWYEGGAYFTMENDPSLSDFDKMVAEFNLPNLILGALPCGEECPGYTPLPVEPFPDPHHPKSRQVKCKRLFPYYHIGEDTPQRWQEIRDFTVNTLKELGRL